MFYHDLDIWIERGADGALSLRSMCASHGEYRDRATLDVAALASSESALVNRVIDLDRQIALGTSLYHTLFVGDEGKIQFHFGQCHGGAQAERSRGVRLRLRCATADLARVPWEYLHSEMLGGFLGASARTPVVRYLELPRPILELECPTPARMLLVIPEGSGLDTTAEKDRLAAAMRELEGVVTATTLEGRVTEADVVRALSRDRYQLFHFIGHGDFENNTGYVLLNQSAGPEWDYLDHERFGSLFINHPTLKLIVLNSCKGAEGGEGHATPHADASLKPFVGMAPELVRQGIPAVVAMHYEILDEEAIAFAAAFYESLFRSADRGRVELAMSQARQALGRKFKDTGAVGTPVLFMHAKEGVLFDQEATTALGKVPVSPRAIARTTAIDRTHKENERALQLEPGAVTNEEIEKERQSAARVRRRLRLGIATVMVGAATSLAMAYLAMVIGFLALPPWARIETYAIWVSDVVGHHDLDPRIKLVTAGRDPKNWYGGAAFGPSWRPAHAVVIDKLREAHAPVIVLAFALTSASPNDAPLAVALRQARAAGTRVLVAANTYDNGVARVAPELAGWVDAGFACFGELRIHSARFIPVLLQGPGAGERPRLSLPLLTTATVRGESVAPLDQSAYAIVMQSGAAQVRRIGLFDLERPSAADTPCAAIQEGDVLANEIIDYSSLSLLRAAGRRFEYMDVHNGTRPLPDLRGTIVVVGAEQAAFPVWRGFGTEHRYQPEVLADAINTVLNGIVIRPASPPIQTLVVALMTVLGACVGAAPLFRSRWKRVAALDIIVAGYVAMSGAFYASGHVMLNTVFHLLALVVSFAFVRFVHRTWFAA
jgi:CHASE2 domain-containing sensor protein